jgi:uncharacterized delta-60 repeat protein
MSARTRFIAVPLALAAGLAAAQSIDSYAPSPQGPVATVAIQRDGKAIVAGNFFAIGSDTRGGVARLDVDGSVDASFGNAAANGEIVAVAVEPDGRILVGGDFTSIGGATRHSLARLNADGTLDASFADPAIDGKVWAIALQPDGKIFIGGGFANVGAHPRNYFARLDADGTFDGTFADSGLCCNPLVDAIALEGDGSVLIGGAFAHVGDVSHAFFARFSSSGAFDPTFPLSTDVIQPAAIVVAPDGSIYISDSGRADIEKYDTGGALAAGFTPVATDGAIDGFALQPNGKLVIAGTFAAVGGVARHALARLDADGSLDATFGDLGFALNPSSGTIYGIAAQDDGAIITVGNFMTAGGVARSGIARVVTGDYATRALVVRGDGGALDVTWYRLGDGAELAAPPVLMASGDGTNFAAVGAMTRVANGWHATASGDVHGAPIYLKAVGETSDGANDASIGGVESGVWTNDEIFANGFE